MHEPIPGSHVYAVRDTGTSRERRPVTNSVCWETERHSPHDTQHTVGEGCTCAGGRPRPEGRVIGGHMQNRLTAIEKYTQPTIRVNSTQSLTRYAARSTRNHADLQCDAWLASDHTTHRAHPCNGSWTRTECMPSQYPSQGMLREL
jgi:hypothetical protein